MAGSVSVRMAWRNLWRHARRTWLTVGAMAFSNALLIFSIGLQYGTYDLMIENGLQLSTGYLQVQPPGYHDEPRIYRTIDAADPLAAELRALPGITGVAPRAEAFALVASEQRSYGVQVMGVDPDAERAVSSLPGLVGRGDYLGDDGDGIVIGQTLARNLKVDIGDELTLLGTGRDGSFAAAIVRVTGLFESGVIEVDRQLAQVSLETFREAFSMGDGAHRLVIRVPGLDAVEPAAVEIGSVLQEQRPDLALLDWDQMQPGFRQMIQADMASAWVMYAVLIALVAFSVLNTQLMSVMERTHEFGVVMALGVRPGRLSRLVLLETALLGLIGTAAGIAIGALINGWLSVHGFAYPGMEEMAAKFNLPGRMYPELSLAALGTGPAFVYVASLLAAIWPATRLLRLKPIEAMQAVG